jgi:hypothetical protein
MCSYLRNNTLQWLAGLGYGLTPTYYSHFMDIWNLWIVLSANAFQDYGKCTLIILDGCYKNKQSQMGVFGCLSILNTFYINIAFLDEFWNYIKQTLSVFGWEWKSTIIIHLLSGYKVHDINCFVGMHVSLKGIGNTRESWYWPWSQKPATTYVFPFLLLDCLYFQQAQQEWMI